VTLPLADVDARWMAIAHESMKLDGSTCERNGYPKSGMMFVTSLWGA
jgi:hypothetical protein